MLPHSSHSFTEKLTFTDYRKQWQTFLPV